MASRDKIINIWDPDEQNDHLQGHLKLSSFHPIWLKFDDEHLEATFSAFWKNHQRKINQKTGPILSVIWALWGLIDMKFYPDQFVLMILTRIAGFLFAVLVWIIMFKRKKCMCCLVGFTCFLMSALAAVLTCLNGTFSTAGFVLVAVAANVLIELPFFVFVVADLAAPLAYFLILLLFGHQSLSHVLDNTLFVFWASMFLLTNAYKKEVQFRKEFRATQMMLGQYKLRAEEALELSRVSRLAADAKSRFLAVMSHEMRGPLNGIHSMTQLLARSDLASDDRESVMIIERSSELLLSLISDLLDVSRFEANSVKLSPEVVDLIQLIEDIVCLCETEVYQRENLEIYAKFEVGVPTSVFVDKNRLKQIILNLAWNAVKFCQRGEISIEVSVRRDGLPRTPPPNTVYAVQCKGQQKQQQETKEDCCHRSSPTLLNNEFLVAEERQNCDHACLWSDEPTLCISVRDVGLGIDPADLPNVFDEFWQKDTSATRKYNGAGLGLSICKKLVRAMNGQLSATSIPGSPGTSFCVHLPLSRLRIPGTFGHIRASILPLVPPLPIPLPHQPSSPLSIVAIPLNVPITTDDNNQNLDNAEESSSGLKIVVDAGDTLSAQPMEGNAVFNGDIRSMFHRALSRSPSPSTDNETGPFSSSENKYKPKASTNKSRLAIFVNRSWGAVDSIAQHFSFQNFEILKFKNLVEFASSFKDRDLSKIELALVFVDSNVCNRNLVSMHRLMSRVKRSPRSSTFSSSSPRTSTTDIFGPNQSHHSSLSVNPHQTNPYPPLSLRRKSFSAPPTFNPSFLFPAPGHQAPFFPFVFIWVTNTASRPTNEEVASSGFTAQIGKPIKIRCLVKVIELCEQVIAENEIKTSLSGSCRESLDVPDPAHGPTAESEWSAFDSSNNFPPTGRSAFSLQSFPSTFSPRNNTSARKSWGGSGSVVQTPRTGRKSDTFCVHASASPRPLDGAPTREPLIVRPLRILVVDDNAINVRVLQKALSGDKYSVFTARDGLEALECVEQASPCFDIIFMDLHMPNLSGIEATMRIRALSDPNKSSVAIVALSADVSDETLSESFQAGVNEFLTKPIQMSALFASIQKLVHRDTQQL